MVEARNDGRELENQFAAYLKEKMGFAVTETRRPVNGKAAQIPYDVDVHGARTRMGWWYVRQVGFWLSLFGLAACLLPHAWIFDRIAWLVERLDRSLVGNGFALYIVASVLTWFAGYARSTEHTWVECKDHADKVVRREDIMKLYGSVCDVRNNSRDSWTPHRVMFVSRRGFHYDALNVARAFKFECYEATDDGFERRD